MVLVPIFVSLAAAAVPARPNVTLLRVSARIVSSTSSASGAALPIVRAALDPSTGAPLRLAEYQ